MVILIGNGNSYEGNHMNNSYNYRNRFFATLKHIME